MTLGSTSVRCSMVKAQDRPRGIIEAEPSNGTPFVRLLQSKNDDLALAHSPSALPRRMVKTRRMKSKQHVPRPATEAPNPPIPVTRLWKGPRASSNWGGGTVSVLGMLPSSRNTGLKSSAQPPFPAKPQVEPLTKGEHQRVNSS